MFSYSKLKTVVIGLFKKSLNSSGYISL